MLHKYHLKPVSFHLMPTPVVWRITKCAVRSTNSLAGLLRLNRRGSNPPPAIFVQLIVTDVHNWMAKANFPGLPGFP